MVILWSVGVVNRKNYEIAINKAIMLDHSISQKLKSKASCSLDNLALEILAHYFCVSVFLIHK